MYLYVHRDTSAYTHAQEYLAMMLNIVRLPLLLDGKVNNLGVGCDEFLLNGNAYDNIFRANF